jgi:signal transduction histidine kinase
MEDVLKETVFWMRKEAENHGVVINFNSSKVTLKEVSVDSDRIKQVLINLIINAVHSMPDGGKVDISIKGVRAPKRGVEISVSDEGAGISEEDLSRVFDPFYTTKSDGTGLGLAVSMKIVKDHGGDLSIDSTINCGTTCKIFLPYSTKGESHAA